jgi:DNA-binding NtrC family response regulator
MSDRPATRILIVDDDQASRETLLEWVQRQGWEAVAVRDGEMPLGLQSKLLRAIESESKLSSATCQTISATRQMVICEFQPINPSKTLPM